MLDGAGGNDMLFGRGGNDRLDGGADDDRSTAGRQRRHRPYAAARIAGGPAGWTVTATGGTDTLTDVEIVDDSASGQDLLVGHGGFATIQAAIDAASDGNTIVRRRRHLQRGSERQQGRDDPRRQ